MLTENEKTVDVGAMQVAPGLYRMTSARIGVDYRDEGRDRCVCSIGQNKATGEILAALDDRFVRNPRFKCLWLR